MTEPNAVRPESLIDRKVVDPAGRKIGSVGQVYLDDRTGQPAWITLNTGLFGMTENFVPLIGSNLAGNTLVLPWRRKVVKDSPAVRDASHLDVTQERDLYSYYWPHLGRSAAAVGDDRHQAVYPGSARPDG